MDEEPSVEPDPVKQRNYTLVNVVLLAIIGLFVLEMLLSLTPKPIVPRLFFLPSPSGVDAMTRSDLGCAPEPVTYPYVRQGLFWQKSELVLGGGCRLEQ